MSPPLERVVPVIAGFSLAVVAAAGLALFIGVTRPTSLLQGVLYVMVAVSAWVALEIVGELQWRAVQDNPLARRVLERTKESRFISPLRIGYLLLACLVPAMVLGLLVWGLISLGRMFWTS